MMLCGKNAVVTGGTRGIGYAIVKKFLENGANVALCGSKQESAEKAAAQFKNEYPDSKVMALWPDMGNPESIAKAFEAAREELGSLDILVNNAGLSARESIYDYDTSEFDKVVALNLNSVFYGCQAAARIMKEQGGGVILNTSSMVSRNGQPAGVAYPASKFAVNGLTVSLARELGKDNIRVNAVAPGIIKTDMVAALPEAMIAPMIARVPLGRIGEPEDIANAFLFLASDLASYISGTVLSVDGATLV